MLVFGVDLIPPFAGGGGGWWSNFEAARDEEFDGADSEVKLCLRVLTGILEPDMRLGWVRIGSTLCVSVESGVLLGMREIVEVLEKSLLARRCCAAVLFNWSAITLLSVCVRDR